MKYKNCLKCGTKVSKNCRLGYCNACRNRSGEKNPFYGKKHVKETIEKMKIKDSKAIKNKWKNEEYKQKVIKGVSKPRRESFKKEQSDRVKEWYRNNSNQKEIRSIEMKKNWAIGKIKPNTNSINESKLEKEFRTELKRIFPKRNIRKSTIRIRGKWFYPDVRIDKNFIIEFYGDYWHANPRIFNSNDIIHHGLTAKQIWHNDIKREDILKNNGFRIFTVWQDEWKNNRKNIIRIIRANL
jgi:very-short-patch-repair endonuclease